MTKRKREAIDAARRAADAMLIHGNVTDAAASIGVPRTTFHYQLAKAIAMDIYTPVLDVSDMLIAPAEKPRIRVKAVSQETPPEGPVYKVVAIGDLHDAPGQSKDRFEWLGKFVAERKPDRVVQIGDWGTFDSVSQHDPVGSKSWMDKPSFTQDLDSLEDSLAAFRESLGGFSCPLDVTLGNHEHRVQRASDADPKRFGDAMLRVEEQFSRYGAKTHPYGSWVFIGGVGFTHVPFNGMGRDYRGKRPENMIGNDAIFSIVFGHTHKRGFWTFPKIGPQRRIDILNLGSAMEHGHVEQYASLSMTGWSWGIYDLTIQGGTISEKFASMIELKERFG